MFFILELHNNTWINFMEEMILDNKTSSMISFIIVFEQNALLRH